MNKLLNILGMFGPLTAAKFWVAVVMALTTFVDVYLGFDLGLDQGTVASVVNGVGALLVWLLPNKKKKKLPVYTDEQALAVNNRVTGKNQTTVYKK